MSYKHQYEIDEIEKMNQDEVTDYILFLQRVRSHETDVWQIKTKEDLLDYYKQRD